MLIKDIVLETYPDSWYIMVFANLTFLISKLPQRVVTYPQRGVGIKWETKCGIV